MKTLRSELLDLVHKWRESAKDMLSPGLKRFQVACITDVESVMASVDDKKSKYTDDEIDAIAVDLYCWHSHSYSSWLSYPVSEREYYRKRAIRVLTIAREHGLMASARDPVSKAMADRIDSLMIRSTNFTHAERETIRRKLLS